MPRKQKGPVPDHRYKLPKNEPQKSHWCNRRCDHNSHRRYRCRSYQWLVRHWEDKCYAGHTDTLARDLNLRIPNMSKIADDLFQVVDRLESINIEFDLPEIRISLERLKASIKKAAKAWSGSWLGFHSRIYYRDFSASTTRGALQSGMGSD